MDATMQDKIKELQDLAGYNVLRSNWFEVHGDALVRAYLDLLIERDDAVKHMERYADRATKAELHIFHLGEHPPCVNDHKYFDFECHQNGCKSLALAARVKELEQKLVAAKSLDVLDCPDCGHRQSTADGKTLSCERCRLEQENAWLRGVLEDIRGMCDVSVRYYTTRGQHVNVTPKLNLSGAKELLRILDAALAGEGGDHA